MRVYDFQEQLAIGKQGESIIKDWLSPSYQITNATMEQERQGIDFIGVHRVTGNVVKFQVKADHIAYNTQRAFIEIQSCDTPPKPGWVHTCAADIIVYYLPQNQKAFLVKPFVLRATLPKWQARYELKRSKNNSYYTSGILVPLAEFGAVADRIEVIR